eukprot:CAMPEP_0197529430 /NCGR_PEP_ID=MMETSP1318-20131121/28384_1 /TAXON_ID=552666 /ORGANISM="Partenskyella glossopodia, Strain RCC365" /LENGTH=225 /DNA_ID=CAMNT_0043084887 /DNA_START=45 /DNA_END=723 /DNA_ORIENTATION=-
MASDKNSGEDRGESVARFQKLQNVYEILVDPQRRKSYDFSYIRMRETAEITRLRKAHEKRNKEERENKKAEEAKRAADEAKRKAQRELERKKKAEAAAKADARVKKQANDAHLLDLIKSRKKRKKSKREKKLPHGASGSAVHRSPKRRRKKCKRGEKSKNLMERISAKKSKKSKSLEHFIVDERETEAVSRLRANVWNSRDGSLDEKNSKASEAAAVRLKEWLNA